MGREIRRVPANWNHPTMEDSYGREKLQPMFNETYEAASARWLADFDRIRSGDTKSYEIYAGDVVEWAHDNPAPDPNYYQPWNDEDATWWQVWETVTEGTPVSPPFETQEELIDYLAEHGDFWDQKRCNQDNWVDLWGGKPGVSGWGRERAERFVRGARWAPSFVMVDGAIVDGVTVVTE